jgi:hypothetical protein
MQHTVYMKHFLIVKLNNYTGMAESVIGNGCDLILANLEATV